MCDDRDDARAAFGFGMIARLDRGDHTHAGIEHTFRRALHAQLEYQIPALDRFRVDIDRRQNVRSGHRRERFRFGKEAGELKVAALALPLAPVEVLDFFVQPGVGHAEVRGDLRDGYERLLVEMARFRELLGRELYFDGHGCTKILKADVPRACAGCGVARGVSAVVRR